MQIKTVYLFLGFLFIINGIAVKAQPTTSDRDTSRVTLAGQKLTVGVKQSAPFVIQNGKNMEGLSISLWENVAKDLDVDYTYKIYPDLQSLLEGVENKEVDLSVNPLTVTRDRLEKMDFTQPFFITNLAIAAKSHEKGMFLRFINKIFSWQFFTAIGVLALIILAFGFVTWLFERKSAEQEFTNNVSGLWDAFWWSAVTMTTVGYGDKAPKTTGGRAVAIVWMFTAVIMISSYTAAIASSLTVNELSLDIKNLDDLHKAKVVTVKSSAAEAYLKTAKFDYETVATAAEAVQKVGDGEADAMVYDEPIMRYEILNANLQSEIVIAPSKFFTQYYGFAVPPNRAYLKTLNLSLVQEIKSNDWKTELGKYGLE